MRRMQDKDKKIGKTFNCFPKVLGLDWMGFFFVFAGWTQLDLEVTSSALTPLL